MALLAVVAAACSSSPPGRCTTHQDCNPGFYCLDGICRDTMGEPDAGGEPADGGEPPADPGDPGPGDPGPSDPGPSDPGPGDADQPGDGDDAGADHATGWTITPGLGVGPLQVSSGPGDSAHVLGAIRTTLGESGQAVGQAKYTLSFHYQLLWATGIDSGAPNQMFDDQDHVISLVIWPGLGASTAEGLGPGSTFSQVRAQARYANPDRSAVYPPYGEYPGGKMDFFFGLGLYIGYDADDVAAFFTVTRSYPQTPNATIDPAGGSLRFSTATVYCGDGYNSGSTQDVHRGVLGSPDWTYSFDTTVETGQYGPIDVQFYTDSYRVLGMEFVGGDDVIFTYIIDRLVLVMLYPPFYGKTAAGNGLGSARSSWEAELGAPVQELSDPNYQGKMFVYQAGSRQFGITYTNEGASPDDIATLLVLNYQAS